MPRRKSKKKQKQAEPQKAIAKGPLEHQPFSALKDLKIQHEKPQSPSPEPAPATPPPADDDPELFEAAMSDVKPAKWSKVRRAPQPHRRPPQRVMIDERREVLAHLENLVAGRGQFDLVDSDEYLEGYVRGINPLILEKLRRGRFSIQSHLDLHGLTVKEAEEAVQDFIVESIALRRRCVLLIHGRGLNSKDQIPVLKKRMEAILLRGPVRKAILAFTSARPVDGGAGASYVLLRAKN
jgi:DNA-nicking Smr family endonuclease